jgi:hypothetical protein
MSKMIWRLIMDGILLVGVVLANADWREHLGMNSAGETSVRQAYLDRRNLLVDRFYRARGTLAQLSYQPQWGHEDWIQQMADQYVLIASLYADYQQLTPPVDIVDAHSAQVKAMKICKAWAERSSQAVIDKAYHEFVNIQDTLGVQCDTANAETEELYREAPGLVVIKPRT